MADDPQTPERFTLSRWSRRKLAAAREAKPDSAATAAAQSPTAPAMEVASVESPAAAPAAADVLPAVETLTFDSDFVPYFQPKVGEDTKRAALKKLFSNPRFNVMDGLDIYIDDYTRSDPMPEGMLDRLANVYGILQEQVTAPDAPGAAGELPAPIANAASADTAPVTTLIPAADAGPPPATGDGDVETVGERAAAPESVRE